MTAVVAISQLGLEFVPNRELVGMLVLEKSQ